MHDHPIVEWSRPWGGHFRFAHCEARRRAFCLADCGVRGPGRLAFYVAIVERDPVTAERFNMLPWMPENLSDARAVAAFDEAVRACT